LRFISVLGEPEGKFNRGSPWKPSFPKPYAFTEKYDPPHAPATGPLSGNLFLVSKKVLAQIRQEEDASVMVSNMAEE